MKIPTLKFEEPIYSRLDHMERTPPGVSRPKSREAALQALALNDSLAEPHVVLGNYKMYYEWDWLGAEKELRRALELDPRAPGPRSAMSSLFAYTGRREQGIQEMRRAIELNPDQLGLNTGLGLQLLYAGRAEEAEAQIRKVLAVNRNEAFACYQLAYVRWVRGDVDGAMTLWDRFHDLANGDPGVDAEAHNAYQQAGGGAGGHRGVCESLP